MNRNSFVPLPALGDIVYCRFPVIQGVPAIKPRPALVTALVTFKDGTNGVRVAYGTSKKLTPLFGGEFSITPNDHAAYISAGLSFPTKFNLKKHVDLPYTDEWFSVPPSQPFGQSPKLGILHPSLVRRAQAAFDAVQSSSRQPSF